MLHTVFFDTPALVRPQHHTLIDMALSSTDGSLDAAVADVLANTKERESLYRFCDSVFPGYGALALWKAILAFKCSDGSLEAAGAVITQVHICTIVPRKAVIASLVLGSVLLAAVAHIT